MPEKINWITFRAHSSHWTGKEDSHPDFFGTFVCPVARTEPEQLLKELLTNRKLFLVQITDTEVKKESDNWGLHERLKSSVASQGYGIALLKMAPRPIALQ
jgi:hypothetical protein